MVNEDADIETGEAIDGNTLSSHITKCRCQNFSGCMNCRCSGDWGKRYGIIEGDTVTSLNVDAKTLVDA